MASASETIGFDCGAARLEFSRADGRVMGLYRGGTNLLAPSDKAFEIRMLDDSGEYLILDNSDFGKFHMRGKTLVWSECDKFPELRLEVTVGCTGDEFRFKSAVKGIPNGIMVDYVCAPRICAPLKSELFYPWSEGVIVTEDVKKSRKDSHLNFPDSIRFGYYPGIVQMQFIASYSQKGGVYFAADDIGRATKVIDFANAGKDKISLRIEAMCGSYQNGAECVIPFDVVLRPFDGNWYDACQIYRNWVKKTMSGESVVKIPWLDESPVTVIYVVRGAGPLNDKTLDYSQTNALIPYENAYPHIMRLSKEFDSKVMALIMRWDHNGPWQPPYYWPPVGGAESFRKFVDMLHKSGNYIGVYGSGTMYSKKSKVNDFDSSVDYAKNNIAKITTRGPKGQSRMSICEQLRDSEGLCISCKKARDIMEEQALICARENVDFFQLFDQNMGCTWLICYSKEHGHPRVPGQWQTEAMRGFLKDLNAKIRLSGSSMVLGTEGAAADPYVCDLPFNDLRDASALRFGKPVHGYQYVFHAYTNNFYGNQCEVPTFVKLEEAPDNLLFRLAYAFNGGEMLSVVMRQNGQICWGASTPWTMKAPEQAPVFKLVKNLNAARKKYSNFLIYGEMIKPEIEVSCRTYVMPGKRRTLYYPEVLTSAWRDSDGNKIQFFVNFKTEKTTCKIGGKDTVLPPCSVLAINLPR